MPLGFCRPATQRGIPRLYTNKSFNGFETNSLQHFLSNTFSQFFWQTSNHTILFVHKNYSIQVRFGWKIFGNALSLKKKQGSRKSLDIRWLLVFHSVPHGASYRSQAISRQTWKLHYHFVILKYLDLSWYWKNENFRESFMTIKKVDQKYQTAKSLIEMACPET